MNRTLLALVAKDLRLHRQPIVLTTAALLGICTAATHVGSDRSMSAFAGFVFRANALVVVFLPEWLVARERATRTFAWLRTLPVDDHALVGSKFLLAAAVCVAQWTATSGLFVQTLWSPWTTGLVLQCMLLVLGALCLGARLRFNWHYAHVAGMLVFVAPVMLFMAFAGDGTARQAALATLWNAPYGRPLAAAGLLLIYLSIVGIIVRWFVRADTYRIVD